MNKTIRMLELINMKIALDVSECIEEVKEINSKATKWEDPQTQADLELGRAVRAAEKQHAFKISFTSTNEKSGYKILSFRWIRDLINWHKEQLRGESND